jgi:hypothetical protein
MIRSNTLLDQWFPKRRLNTDFPLVLWFAGLWFYLKSFLYLCNAYTAGMDPPPYPLSVIVETVYFALAIIPALLLGKAMWNESRRMVVWAIVFLGIDMPILLFHVFRLGYGGFLDSGLNKALEIGSLGLDFLVFGWLTGDWVAHRTGSSSKPVA